MPICKSFLFLLLLSSILGFTSFLCCQATTPESAACLAIIHARIIDGTGVDPIEDGVVLIRGNRITAAAKTGEVHIPSDAEVIDARGRTLLPGLIDSHVHSAAPPSVRRRFLRAGYTSICDLGSPLKVIALFEKEYDGSKAAARGFRAGPIITAPGGLPDAVLHENLNFEVADPEAARKGVTDLVQKGADVIKIYLEPSDEYPMVDLERVKAVVDAAHAEGILVRAHVSKLAALDTALQGGVDVIEHVPKPGLNNAKLTERLSNSKDPMKDLYDIVVAPEYDEQLPRIVRKGAVLVPTLARGLGRFYKNKNATEAQRVIGDGVIEIVRRYHALGGRIALGTDFNANTEEHIPGEMQFEEIKLLSAAGLEPLEIIKACTQEAARVSGRGKDLGTIEPGKLADLILVDGDPLADLTALRRIAMVVKDGAVAYKPH